MYAAFVRLLNMSAAAGILIAVVILLRLILRKTPKKYICILWAIVALRLICPISISSAVSAFNYIGHTPQSSGQIEYIQYNGKPEKPMGELPVFSTNTLAPDSTAVTEHRPDFYLPTVMRIWAIGMAAMVLYAAHSYQRVQVQVRESIPLDRRNYRRDIYLCDHIPTPFILGILRPKIYLPSALTEEQQHSVIAHERAHIARLDHLWKPLGFLLLSVHWFNPLVWVAYILLCRDIEMACDEKVIAGMTPAQKQAYSTVLLTCSMPRKAITACPLAFGESGVKQRIKGILNYRKPSFWVVMIAVVICVAVAVSFLTNPESASDRSSFEMIVGTGYVYSIRVTTPRGSGTCRHADSSPYVMGERVSLEPMEGLDDWAGVTVEALGQNGETIWSCSIPENIRNVLTFQDNSWTLLRSHIDTNEFVQVSIGPCGYGIGYMNFQLPKGIAGLMSFRETKDGSDITLSFLKDNQVIGGVRTFPMEAEPDVNSLDWIHSLDLPEWKGDNVGYSASGSNGIYSIEFFSDVPPGEPRTLRNVHQLYYFEGKLYDLWFDDQNGDKTAQDAILKSVYLSSVMQDQAYPEASRTYDIWPLPVGYDISETEHGNIVFSKDGAVVGGIDSYPIPLNAYDPEDTAFHWLERNGISDFGNPDLYYSGGMSFFSNQWTAYFTSDNPKIERHHRFQIAGNYIFDTWLDGLKIDYDTRQEILTACKCKAHGQLPDAEHTLHSQSDAEETAYQAVSAALNALSQNDATYIFRQLHRIGKSAPNDRITDFYLADSDLYIYTEEMVGLGKYHTTLYTMVDWTPYVAETENSGKEALQWKRCEEELPYPWLAGIDWNRQAFQYTGTRHDGTMTVYDYHSDLWFENDPGGYDLSFYFYPDGQFDSVVLRINTGTAEEYTVTEVLQPTDAEIIRSRIDTEYGNATDAGQNSPVSFDG